MKQRGVTARALSKATSVPESTISDWTSGREPKLNDAVVRVARFLGVSVDFLVTGKEPEQDLVAEALEKMTEGFFEVHRGVYRLRVEKLVGTVKKDEVSDEDE